MLSESVAIINGLSPSADRFDGNPGTDVVNAGLCDEVTFILSHRGGTTGKAKLRIEACDDTTPTTHTPVPFRYRKKTTGASDVWGDITTATADDGVETTPGEDTCIEASVKSNELADGKPFVRALLTETADDPVDASVIIICSGLRYGGKSPSTLLA